MPNSVNKDQLLSRHKYDGLVQFLNAQNTDTVGLFSARQSKSLDDRGNEQNKTISAIQIIQFITAELTKLSKRDIRLNPYLLADSFSYPSLCVQPQSPGVTFLAMFAELFTDYRFRYYEVYFDEMKRLLLFMRLHQFCSYFPDEKIKWHIYDDRFDILTCLYDFVANNPELVPSNVEITFFQYGQYFYKNRVQLRYNLIPWQYKQKVQGTGSIELNHNNIYYYYSFVMEKLNDKACDFVALLKDRIRLGRSMPPKTKINPHDFTQSYRPHTNFQYEATRQHVNGLDNEELKFRNIQDLIKQYSISEAEYECFF